MLFAGPAMAQPLDLYTAINRSINNYPSVQQRQAEILAGQAHITTVEGNRFPSLKIHDQVTLGTANSENGSFFPMGVVVPTAGGIRSENNGKIASGNIALSLLEWEVCNFGYYRAEKQNAEAGLALKQALLKDDQYIIAAKVASYYFDFHKQYRLLTIEKENQDRMATILSTIRATVSSGLKPGVDSATANAEYSKAKIAYLQSLNDYQNDRAELAMFTGLDTTAILPDTSLFAQTFDDKMSKLQVTDSIDRDNPLLAVYTRQYEQKLQENNMISHKYLPKVFLQGAAWMRGSSISPQDVYATDLTEGLAYSRYNYLLGLAVTYNLFDLKHRRDQLKEGRFEADAKQSELQSQRLNLARVLQQANNSYAIQLLKLRELPKQLNAAREAYTQQLALYKAGLNTIVDLTNALYVLNTSETDYVLALDDLFQLQFTRAELGNNLDEFLQTFKK